MSDEEIEKLSNNIKKLSINKPEPISKPYPGLFFKKTYDDGKIFKIFTRFDGTSKIYFYPETTKLLSEWMVLK